MSNYKIVNTNDIVYTKSPIKSNPYGIIRTNKQDKGIVSTLYAVYHPTKFVFPNFIELYFSNNLRLNKYLKPIVNIGAKHDMKVANEEVINHKVIFPTVNEQKAINELFLKLDKLLSLQQRKLEYFMTIKAELLRSIFPNTIGKRGLHISDQPWKLQTMNDIFKEKNIKNEHGKLLSVSISKGIYPFSENERKNNSSNNKSNYKEVKYNDIAYNSMRMWQGALGVSKYDGIVSPAYTVITAKKQENPLFYYYYFKNKRMLFNFRQHSQGLTSDTWNLKFPLFKKIIIQTPISKKEEQIIANLFKTLDQNIIYTKTKIEKFNYIKQFLLQNMFI